MGEKLPVYGLRIEQKPTYTQAYPKTTAASSMAPIAQIEYFRVPPRWLFVKITDTDGNYGWGEASLEGHTEAVEGSLAAFAERFTGADAE